MEKIEWLSQKNKKITVTVTATKATAHVEGMGDSGSMFIPNLPKNHPFAKAGAVALCGKVGIFKKEADLISAAITREIKKEYTELLKNVTGLDELEAAINDEIRYEKEFEKMMEDEMNDGVFSPKKPTENIDDLKIKYPVAAAYIKAESFSYSEHFVKSNAGRLAKEKIANGEDYVAALKEMDDEWSKYCEEHIWD